MASATCGGPTQFWGARMAEDRRRVLVADRNADLGESLRWLLGAHDMDVEFASTPRSAIRHARTFQPDTALIDLDFPGAWGDGYWVRAWLKRRLPGCRCIAYTGYAGHPQVAQMKAAQFDALLLKPCSLGDLMAAVEGVAA